MSKTNFQIRICKSSAWIQVWTPESVVNEKHDSFKMETWTHAALWHRILNKLTEIGFSVTKNPRIEKNYKALSNWNRSGRWKYLEFESDICATKFAFEFYQNINTGDRSPGDGRYAFDKWKLMPYLIKMRFLHSVDVISAVVQSTHSNVEIEYVDKSVMSEQAILENCHNNHWKSFSPKTLDEIGPSMKEYDIKHNSTDRDKKQIVCGEIKYFRSYDGRIYRGRVFHHINNMWWVLVNKYSCRNIAAFDLFDLKPEDLVTRRAKKVVIPPSRSVVMASLKKHSTGSLMAELRRRKKLKQSNEADHQI